MSSKILIKRGLSTNLDNAGVENGELKFATDEGQLYIGDGKKNIPLGGVLLPMYVQKEPGVYEFDTLKVKEIMLMYEGLALEDMEENVLYGYIEDV